MSNSLSVSAITETLRNLLTQGTRDNPPGTAVTTRPPDKARVNNTGNQLNVFLYQTALNAAWSNADMPNQVKPGETGAPPLPLNLYYLLTAYGEDDNDDLGHRVLGRAMSILHDHPVLSSDDIRLSVDAADLPKFNLQHQLEGIRISYQPMSLDEMSKLWTAFQTGYRISAAYEVAVVLIDSQRPTRSPLPVLRQGDQDRGPASQPDLTPPFPELFHVQPPDPRYSAELGDTLTLVGHHLAGDEVEVRLRHRLLDAPRVLPAPDGTDRRITVHAARRRDRRDLAGRSLGRVGGHPARRGRPADRATDQRSPAWPGPAPAQHHPGQPVRRGTGRAGRDRHAAGLPGPAAACVVADRRPRGLPRAARRAARRKPADPGRLAAVPGSADPARRLYRAAAGGRPRHYPGRPRRHAAELRRRAEGDRLMGGPADWERASEDYLAAALAWVRLLLEQRVRMGSATILTPGPTTTAPPEKPESRWRPFRSGPAHEAGVAAPQPVAALPAAPTTTAGPDDIAAAAAAVASAEAADPPPAFVLVARRFGLTDFERNVLLLCVAAELDPSVPELCGRAQGDTRLDHPTFALAFNLFDQPTWEPLRPDRPLRHFNLIEIYQPPGTPLTRSILRVDERVVGYVKGATFVDDLLTTFLVSLDEYQAGIGPPPSQAAVVEQIVGELAATSDIDRLPVVQLLGSDAPTKQLIASRAADALGLHLYRLPAELLPADAGESERLTRLWQRESVLIPIALYLDAHDDGSREPTTRATRFLARSGGVVFVDADEVVPTYRRSSIVVDVAQPTADEQTQAWRQALGPAARRRPGAAGRPVRPRGADDRAHRPGRPRAPRRSARSASGPGRSAWSRPARASTPWPSASTRRRPGKTSSCPTPRCACCAASPIRSATAAWSTSRGVLPPRPPADSASAPCSPVPAAPARRWRPR